MTFKNAKDHMDIPKKSKEFSFGSVLKSLKLDRLKKRWDHRGPIILEGIFMLAYGKDGVTGNETLVGDPYLHHLLRLFVNKIPILSFSQLTIESHTKRKLVGGAIDIAVGSNSNGNKPTIVIAGFPGRVSLFLGCFGEAKASDVPVGRLGFEEVKSVIQPMFEVIVAAELAIFENDMVPLVNIMGNKTAFRPILYWRKFDVLITTPDVVPLRRNENTLDIQGLLLLFVLFQFHNVGVVSFDEEALKQHSKTGWAQALAAGEDSYKNSKITLPSPRVNLVHQDATYGTVSDESDSESEHEVHLSTHTPPSVRNARTN